jgi:hypothetical protein
LHSAESRDYRAGGLRLLRMLSFLMSLVLITTVASACGDDDDETSGSTSEEVDAVEGAPPSPAEGVQVNERAEEATITIENGKFGSDTLTVQQDEPTVVLFQNKDGQAYRVRFGDVVAMEEIPASAETDVAFNAPNPVETEGELIAADADTVLDTIQFVVQSPSGTSP